jgi:hypothetical protein
MRRTIRRLWTPAVLCGVVMVLPILAGEPDPKPTKDTPKKVVIPFDFESRFDDGQYGRMIGDMIWKKLERQGKFVIPESMLDVRAWSKQSKFLPGPKTSMAKMKDAVCKEQGGDIGIWGKVERVAGKDSDIYDLWIHIADFSATPVKMIYQKKVRTRTVSEIPHTYIKEALERLHGRPAAGSSTTDPAREQRWVKGSNLVKGDLAKGSKHPIGWDPLPRYVTWVYEKGAKPRKRNLCFTFPGDVAETTGVLYYSDYFPVQAGAKYRFQCRWRTTGSAVKVFIKCYDELPTKFSKNSSKPPSRERREVYRSQQNLKGSSGTWNVHTEDFTPTHKHYTPRWGRVMLYAYYPAGKVEWSEIIVKRILPAARAK